MVNVSLVALAAVNVQVDSDGKPEQVKLGAWLNPPRSEKLIVPEPLWPGAEIVMLKLVGLSVKSWTLSAVPAEKDDCKVVSPG